MPRLSNRAGEYVPQRGGYEAFLPKPLPPDPPFQIDDQLWSLLADAARVLGRLDGATEILPNPDLFVFMYVRKEAVLSSLIEGTQASLLDLLEYEAQALRPGTPKDVEEVSNYVTAMNYGLAQVQGGRPLSIQLMREIHERLLKNVRGGELRPGTLREVQNWIGAPGLGIRGATFVPPAVPDMVAALEELEDYLQHSRTLPALVRAGLAHAQFETIHPFLDGNGRMGRLLITLFLTIEGLLERPLLYLSFFFHQHRPTYYEKLQAVRDEGDWEGWIMFFLQGVFEVSEQATATSKEIVALREQHRRLVQENLGASTSNGLGLLESLYQQPIISIDTAAEVTGLTRPSAKRLLTKFIELGIMEETTGKPRNMRYSYLPYLNLMAD